MTRDPDWPRGTAGDCQLVLIDETHAHLLDGLDLGGVRVIQVDDREWFAGFETGASAPSSTSEPSVVEEVAEPGGSVVEEVAEPGGSVVEEVAEPGGSVVEEVALQPSRNHPAADVTDLRIATALPQTATNKVLKRELVREGLDVTDPVWTRAERGRSYSASF